jgi:hypothetical protein
MESDSLPADASGTLDHRKRLLLQALVQSRGIISSACESAAVPRRTFYNWIESDPEFRDAYEDIVERSLDFVESKLLERIEAGSERAICFFLRTRGRSRGYRESGDSSSDLLSDNPVTVAYRPERLRARQVSRFDLQPV